MSNLEEMFNKFEKNLYYFLENPPYASLGHKFV